MVRVFKSVLQESHRTPETLFRLFRERNEHTRKSQRDISKLSDTIPKFNLQQFEESKKQRKRLAKKTPIAKTKDNSDEQETKPIHIAYTIEEESIVRILISKILRKKKRDSLQSQYHFIYF